MAPARFHSDSRHFERDRNVRLLLAPSQNSAARRFLQRAATYGVHVRDPVRPGGGLLRTGDLQTAPAALDHRGVRRLRLRARCAFELPGLARIVHDDASRARRAASADYRDDGDRRTAWLG